MMMLSQHFTKILLSATALSLLSACAVVDKKDTAEPSNWFVSMFERDGQEDAEKASLAYMNGNFKQALELTSDSLKANPRNQLALLVGALSAEKLGRVNKARQYYEDLILINGEETSILGTPDNQPQKISATAKTRLRALTIAQTNLTIENHDGTKTFAVPQQTGTQQSKKAINKALAKKSPVVAKRTNIDNLFPGDQQNIVTRFLILKELAEKDFITKEEFLSRLSHELRVPLHRILEASSSEVIKSDASPADKAAEVRESALKLSDMLDNLFSFSTIVSSDKNKFNIIY